MRAIVLNFHRATHISLIQNESHQQSSEKTKNNGEHERRYYHFGLLSSFINATGLYKYVRNIYLQGLQIPFSSIKNVFLQFIYKFLKF